MNVDGGSLTNTGTVTTTATSVIAASVPVTNAGGTITNSGTFGVTGSTYNLGAGTATGNPIVLSGGAISYTGTGASTVIARSSVNLSGNISTGQTLQLQGDCAVNTSVIAQASFTNTGTIIMTNAGCGSYALLGPATTGLTLTNTGTIKILAGTTAASPRYLRIPVINTGIVNVTDSLTVDQNGGITNNGTLITTVGTDLGVSAALGLTNNAGTITNNGTVSLSNTTYTQKTATVTGNPIVVSGGAISYTGTGASTVIARSSVNLSGNISTGQTLQLQGDCAVNTSVIAQASFTNTGTIIMTNAGCGSYALLGPATTGLTLTNTGTIKILAGTTAASPRYLRMPTTNKGTLELGAGTVLSVDSGSKFTQTSSGTTKVDIDSATSFGALTTSNAVSLNGTLAANRNPAYTPGNGTTWLFMNYPSKSGQFKTITGTFGNRYFSATQAATKATMLTRPKPTVTSLTPASVARDSTALPITVTGTGFGTGTTLMASGDGITFGPITVINATTITTTITVTATTAVGARNITVTRGAGTTTATGVLTIS